MKAEALARSSQSAPAGLPFYQLYFVNRESAQEEQAGVHRRVLKEGRPRCCARLVEMLYVPMGCSGSADECYLLYEDREEFEAAVALAPGFDMGPLEMKKATMGAEEAFKVGIGQFLAIVGQGPIVQNELVGDCEGHLAAALQSTQLAAMERWAAGVLAGRLAAQYRYGYPAARSYFRQAERAATEGSLEQMTAQWWIADSFVQEGKPSEAREAYERIVSSHAARWPKSQIVRRSQAKLTERRKR
jgi:hypothetical protein